MNIGQICSGNVVSAPASAPLSDVARLMCEHHVGAIVITKAPADQPVAAGIITDRDIVRAQLERTADLARLRAEEIMTRDPLVLCTEDSVEEGIRRLSARGVRRAPVVSPSGALQGIISTDDLFAELARKLAGLARLIEGQPRREGADPPRS